MLGVTAAALVWCGGACTLSQQGRFVQETAPGVGGDTGGSEGIGGAGGSAAICGDGNIDDGESCDGAAVGEVTCQSLGFAHGTVACDASCNHDTSGCVDAGCGNGHIDPGEDCDGPELGGATCLTEGFASGMLACDQDCRFTDCVDHYAQDFEGTAGLPHGWTTAGDSLWFISSAHVHGGANSAENGDIGSNDESRLMVTLEYDAPGNISFWHRESTESNYDWLEFYVDTTRVDRWSGQTSWTHATFEVTAGTHDFEWRYVKDKSYYSGQDTVWIDDVVTVNGYRAN